MGVITVFITEDLQQFNIREKQRIFAETYVKSGSGGYAYFVAYEQAKGRDFEDQKVRDSCSKRAYELLKGRLKNTELDRYLDYLRNKSREDAVLTNNEILSILSRIAAGDPDALYYFKKNKKGEIIKRIPRFDIEKLDGMKAIDLINKMLGNYESSPQNSVEINVNLGDDDED